jgi:hypothetical protein
MDSKEDARLLFVGLGEENNRSSDTTTSTKKKRKIVTATTVDYARISTAVVLGNATSSPDIPMADQEKQGEKFCENHSSFKFVCVCVCVCVFVCI